MTHRLGVGMLAVAVAAVVLAVRPAASAAQEHTALVRFRVETEAGVPIAGAELTSGSVRAITNHDGRAALRLEAGRRAVVVRAFGFPIDTLRIAVSARLDTTIVVPLQGGPLAADAIIVVSTRTHRRVEDEPVRVEVLTREEIEEKMLMTPGDISMLLNETSGLRVQTTTPSLGGASVRIQGLRGRYTQILSDGLPLHGAQSGALSMLQIPPMDLGQVEVIKGVASALYGATALGGVVNLISRQPADERELLLNQTTRGGTDAVLWLSANATERWSWSFLGGVHRQTMHDVNNDGWADVPGYERGVVRPRVFWDDGAGRSVFITAGATAENREGGTLPGRATPDGSPYTEALATRRADAGVVGRLLAGGDRLLSVRASGTVQRHTHRFGPRTERDVHFTAFSEVTLTGTDRGHTWVLGAAVQHESYEARDVSGFDFTHTTPSIFAQDEVSPAAWLTVAVSGRVDADPAHGIVFNPRLSTLLRPGHGWSGRLSIGTGYFAPTPFTDDTEVVGLSPLRPVAGLELERARSASLDVGRTSGHLELNGTLFGSEVRQPLMARTFPDGTVELFNAVAPTRTWGTDLLARWHEEPFHLTATYTHTRSTEATPAGPARRVVPLTPRHTAGIVAMWEADGAGRVGLELYYTGRQRLEDNPYRDVSRPYLVIGVLAERRFGAARLFVNAENLLDARQTRRDPLLLPARSPSGRWTTDAWAPLEGRTLNAGVRLEF